MKRWKNLITAVSVLLISFVTWNEAAAHPRGCHRPHYYHYYYSYHRPCRRVYVAPRPVVVVHPAYGYRPRGYYYNHRPYVAYHRGYRRHRW
ncbi:hypothetical protein ACTHGU_19430 [Chitinophagaceae bacterium MMS25-I14]